LAVKGDIGGADHSRENEVGLGGADLVQDRTELGAAKGNVFFAQQFAASLLKPQLGVLVRLFGPYVIGADEEHLLTEVLDHERDKVSRMLVGQRPGADHIL
jgi:hypothetical protein